VFRKEVYVEIQAGRGVGGEGEDGGEDIDEELDRLKA
jgi:hypothetical protein